MDKFKTTMSAINGRKKVEEKKEVNLLSIIEKLSANRKAKDVEAPAK